MSWRMMLPLLLFLVLTVGYIDKIVFHKQGFKSVQNTLVTAEHTVLQNGNKKQTTQREKGYIWAQEQGISEQSHCIGSGDFQQGCEAYILDTIQDARQDLDSQDE